MPNKRSEADPLKVIITAAIGLIVLFVIAGLIYNIFVGKQVAFAGEKTEQVTKDCDGDGAIGLTDDCPCYDSIQKLEKGQQCPAGIKPDKAKDNCPALCKR